MGDWAVKHAKGLLIVLGIAVLGTVGYFATHETTVPEDPSSPGYAIVRDLKREGAIDDFKAVKPDGNWDTVYSLNDGDAHLSFQGTHMEIETRSYDEDLKNAIDKAARQEEFK